MPYLQSTIYGSGTCFYSKVSFQHCPTFLSFTYGNGPIRDPILIPHWSGVVLVLPRCLVGGQKPGPRAFHLVPDSHTIATVKRRRFNRVGDVEEVEGR